MRHAVYKITNQLETPDKNSQTYPEPIKFYQIKFYATFT